MQLYNKKRYKEKAAMKKTLNMHNERNNKHANDEDVEKGAVPAYLLDREGVSRAKVLSNTVKQKRKEKAGKWNVPIPKVRAIADDEMFKVMASGKRKKKSWKRMVTKVRCGTAALFFRPPSFFLSFLFSFRSSPLSINLLSFSNCFPSFPSSQSICSTVCD